MRSARIKSVIKSAAYFFNFFKNILFIVRVTGESCWPELVPSKRYLATNLIKPRIGDYVVFKTKHDEIFVKKIMEIREDSVKKGNYSYFVSGNVSWGESSREFGMVEKNNVIGKIFL